MNTLLAGWQPVKKFRNTVSPFALLDRPALFGPLSARGAVPLLHSISPRQILPNRSKPTTWYIYAGPAVAGC